MADPIETTNEGLLFRWQGIGRAAWKIGEILLAVALGGHMWMTHQNSLAIADEQAKQNERLLRIEKATEACLTKTSDCKKALEK